ncbi:hypothetical protein P43SY_006216 [Pythium insidiosum]|uniref:Iron sulphur domain-containing protein n=1 Tax=Pythium insidiosum TaxID=114742 RepID=A0AAD5LWU7_PYTIN|nr:hypothetical protein P43SY_006216 [Pythium insidiosum]
MWLRRRRRGLRDKLRAATTRLMDALDDVCGVGRDRNDDGKRVLRHVRRVLRHDVPRYFQRMPVPTSYSAIATMPLRDWFYLSPLLLVLAVLSFYSRYLPVVVVFLVWVVNA